MNRKLRFIRPVPEDLRKANDWYDRVSPTVGQRFRAAVSRSFSAILRSPYLKAPLARDIRSWQVHKFPYLVLYRVTGDIVQIIGVLHNASDLDVILTRDDRDPQP